MTNWTEGDLQANGIRLHYLRAGSGTPLILSHGLTDNGRCWTHVAGELARSYDVIAYDARGHGQSEAPEQGYRTEDRVADLVGLMDALGLARAALLGHSMGADTTAMAAALHPGRVSCAVLEDPPWWPAGEVRSARMGDEWTTRLRAQQALPLAELIDHSRVESPGWVEESRAAWAEAKHQANARIFDWLAAPRTPWMEIAATIARPALLVGGDPELGGIIGPELAGAFVERCASGQFARIAGAGHSISRDQPEAYLAAVSEFLRANA